MPKSDGPGLYQVPQDYEALLGADGSDEAWYLAQAVPGDAVLDLGCGGGRLSRAFARRGHVVCGVDSSAAMLERAQELSAGLAIDWRQADWRSMALGRHFQLAVLPYNGLQHLLTLPDLRAFLSGLRAHLETNGRLALDLHLPQAALLARDPDEWFGIDEGPATPSGWRAVAEQSRWDLGAQVLTQRWQLVDADGVQRQWELPLRQYFPLELRALLEAGGFRVLSQAGGFQGETLGLGSLRQVIVAQAL